MTDVKTAYPARYYAAYDVAAAQPTPVTGWYDAWNMSDTSGVPSAGSMVALTAAQWATRQPTGQGVQNGAVVAYTPVVTAVPLKMQAATAQTWINQQIATSFAMGTPFTADMKAYVLAINAIANGTDTASTTLPARPTDVMTTATA